MMLRADVHRDAWRRLKTGATKEDRRLRAAIWWSLAIAVAIGFVHVA